jgi:hypothetical protein
MERTTPATAVVVEPVAVELTVVNQETQDRETTAEQVVAPVPITPQAVRHQTDQALHQAAQVRNIIDQE